MKGLEQIRADETALARKRRGPVGRPSLGKTPTERLEIRIDAARRKRWQRAADAADVALSVWVRDICDAAAR